jgi:predicted histidine transporter YuiF (NhaC family)
MRYYINSSLFAVLLLCFFLPFIEIKCNSNSLGSMSGFSLMTGGDMKMSDASMMDYIKDNEQFKSLTAQRKKNPDIFTLASALLLFTGAILMLVLKSFREQLSIIISLMVMLILLFFRWFLLSQWESQMQGQPDMFSYIKITLNFVTGFWLVITGTAIISALNAWYLIQKKRQNRDIAEFKDQDTPDVMAEL